MKYSFVVSTLALAISLLAAGYVWQTETKQPPLYSTVVDFVAHGRAYDGDRTAVFGFATFAPFAEFSALYMNCDALLNQERGQAVRLVLLRDQFSYDFLESLNGKYVLVSGTYEHPLTLADIEVIEIPEIEFGRPTCFDE